MRMHTIARAGTLDSLSGGILLYSSLVQLIARDLAAPTDLFDGTDDQELTRARIARVTGWDIVARYTCMFAGAAAMCVLAIWA